MILLLSLQLQQVEEAEGLLLWGLLALLLDLLEKDDLLWQGLLALLLDLLLESMVYHLLV
jgi:hypothetical protein